MKWASVANFKCRHSRKISFLFAWSQLSKKATTSNFGRRREPQHHPFGIWLLLRGHRASASPSNHFNLLALPPEVRCQIYNCMAMFTRHDHLNLLLSCRRIFKEGSQSLFRRPLTCSSQGKLIEFVARQTRDNLAHVQNLAIQLRDVDVERMEPFLAQVVLNISTRRHTNPYVLERDRIIETLEKLPNLRHVAFLKPQDGSKAAPKMLLG